MNNVSESSKARKRRREDEIEVDGDDNGEIISLEDCLTFSDTLAALRMMRAQFPHIDKCTLLSLGGKVKDEDISLLINAGFLNRQLIDPNMYWFAIPSIGSVLKGISQGRKELISLLKRTRYKEMMMTSLQKKRLRFSSLDMRFHIRDLIGSGNLRTVQTSTGLLVQLSKD